FVLASFVGPAAFGDRGLSPRSRTTPTSRTAFTSAGFTTPDRSPRSGRNLFFFNLNVLLQFLKLLLHHHVFRVHLERSSVGLQGILFLILCEQNVSQVFGNDRI